MKKRDVIKSYTAADLQDRCARGESRTDLARVRAKSDTELERDIAGDPDLRDVPEDWHAAAQAVMPVPKKLLSLRLDQEVIEWFRSQGPGYQTRMNAVLTRLRGAEDQAGSNKRPGFQPRLTAGLGMAL